MDKYLLPNPEIVDCYLQEYVELYPRDGPVPRGSHQDTLCNEVIPRVRHITDDWWLGMAIVRAYVDKWFAPIGKCPYHFVQGCWGKTAVPTEDDLKKIPRT